MYRYSGNLGSYANISGFHEYYIGNHLADNLWHQVEITRQGKNLLIKLDLTKIPRVIRGKYATLELDNKIYVAGIDQEGEARARKMYQRKLPFPKFEGCLEDIILNRENFATLAKKRDPNITIFGNVSSGCRMTRYLPLRFHEPQSHIVISTAPYSDVLTFSFKFRTYDSDGLVVMHQGKKEQRTDLSLWLIRGRAKLEVNFHGLSRRNVSLHAEKALNDGAWHSIAVSISGRRVRLYVDGVASEHKFNPAKTFTNNLQLVIGSDSPRRVGFIGCMYDIVVQGREVNASRERSTGVLIGQCTLNDHCLPNPCKNGGRCFQQLNQAKCDCSSTHFTGQFCQISAVISRETCADWKAVGATRDGFYMINPSGIKPFVVYCQFHDLKEPITVIKHAMAGQPIKAVNLRTRKAGFYFHPIEYSVDIPVIRALISSSSHCRQHLTYNCMNSVLLDSSHEFDLNKGRGARWISRDGRTMDYWAGATPGSKTCACGVTNSCYRQDLKCNCDTWDDVWRRDEGYITDMEALPVKSVKFSVRATSSKSNFTLGGLECFGKKVIHTTKIPTKLSSTSSSSSSSLSTYEPTNAMNTDTLANITPTTTANAPNNATTPHEPSTYGPPIDNPPIVIIESPRKYITIRQNSNQELILIILSVILAVFILAILILMVRQNLFLPCKCVDGPVYRDVSNVDSIELGPPSSLFTNVDTEVVEYEASPYPPRGMDGVVVNSSRRDSSCRVIHVNVLESDSTDENDRLHLSGGSSPSSEDKEDWNKNNFDKNEYEDFGSLEMVLLKPPQEMMEVQVEKVKEALYEVISASEVNINNNPVAKETKTKDTPSGLLHDEEHYNHTSTISTSGMDFSRPPSYQDIEGACSSEHEQGSDSTHAQSMRSSGSSRWDSDNILEHDDSMTDCEPETSSCSNDLPVNDNFSDSYIHSSSSDAVSDDKVESSHNIDFSTLLSNGPANTDANKTCVHEMPKSHAFISCEDESESEPLLEGNMPSSPSSLNGFLDLNQIANINDCSSKGYNDVIGDPTAHAQPGSAKNAVADQMNSGSRGECFRHETSL